MLVRAGSLAEGPFTSFALLEQLKWFHDQADLAANMTSLARLSRTKPTFAASWPFNRTYRPFGRTLYLAKGKKWDEAVIHKLYDQGPLPA